MLRPAVPAVLCACLVLALWAARPMGAMGAARGFVNFETPHVHPIDLSPDRNTLAAVNTADHRLLLFDVADGKPKLVATVPVGLDPVSVRFRSDDEAWVVNQLSDSVSIVDIRTRRVRATLSTLDEPADVIFAGSPERAFVSCSAVNKVQVFDPDKLSGRPKIVKIDAEEPRAMAVAPNGKTVYVAIFESGNRSTVLPGGLRVADLFERATLPENVVSDPSGPYGGQNPPPNAGAGFEPPIAGDLPSPPPVALIVKRNGQGRWLDDSGGDWTEFVSGSEAGRSRRVQGWDVIDRDLAEINAKTLKVSYREGLMNINMALAVNPSDGGVTVVGTDGINEIRFEPVINGVFLRVLIATGANRGSRAIADLNPHLDYRTSLLPQADRNLSIGDPRGVVWSADGRRGWVSGMGSNNVIEIDASGGRVGSPIEVGEGPTGLAFDDQLSRLYVINKFSATISVVDVDAAKQIQRVKFFDPTPKAIRKGRPHLYDTHRTSGLGHVACASCHVDARTDRLAWDLGVPDGDMISSADRNTSVLSPEALPDWHPMKGPMTTQTFQDIIGKEPHHWRGDRDGLEAFNPAFVGLLGDDRTLTGKQMRQFEKFLATIHFPPNPFREIDNALPTSLDLDGHVTNGRFAPAGRALPNGDAVRGLNLFRNRGLDSGIQCIQCHSLQTGAGSTAELQLDGSFTPIEPGANGEASLEVIVNDASEQLGFKVPHLRNTYDKVGMDFTRKKSRSGFGFFHDGAIDSLARFVGSEVFDVRNDQEVADLVALMLAFSGSDLPNEKGDPPGAESQDAHAAVGKQVTIAAAGQESSAIADMIAVADTGAVELVVRAPTGGADSVWIYRAADGTFRPGSGKSLTPGELTARAAVGSELTFTVVPAGSADLIAGKLLAKRRQRVGSGARRSRSRELREGRSALRSQRLPAASRDQRHE